MGLMSWLLSATFAYSAVYDNAVFTAGDIYENAQDVVIKNTPQSEFEFYKSTFRILDLQNKTQDPKKKIVINLFYGEDEHFKVDDFSNGRAVVIRKGTQWKVTYASPNAVHFDTVRAEPKHGMTCNVEVIKRGFMSTKEVGDMNECLKSLKLIKRNTKAPENVYVIE